MLMNQSSKRLLSLAAIALLLATGCSAAQPQPKALGSEAEMVGTLISGGILSILLLGLLIAILIYNPRLLLRTYPEDVKAAVPPKTPKEQRQTALLGVVFLSFLVGVPLISTLVLKQQQGHLTFWTGFFRAFGTMFTFNLVDLLLLDWLIFCTITPKFVVIPGTEGMRGYKDYGMHFRAFLSGTILSVLGGSLVSLVALVL